MKNVLYAVFTALLWLVAYVLPILGLAGLVGIPIAHIWVDFSWWWMLVPVAAGLVWGAAVILIMDTIGG